MSISPWLFACCALTFVGLVRLMRKLIIPRAPGGGRDRTLPPGGGAPPRPLRDRGSRRRTARRTGSAAAPAAAQAAAQATHRFNGGGFALVNSMCMFCRDRPAVWGVRCTDGHVHHCWCLACMQWYRERLTANTRMPELACGICFAPCVNMLGPMIPPPPVAHDRPCQVCFEQPATYIAGCGCL